MDSHALSFKKRVIDFINRMNTDLVGEYRMWANGHVTLYASSYAVMTLHYLGALDTWSQEEKDEWVAYLNSWQDSDTGLFVGPELRAGGIGRDDWSFESVAMHMTSITLPAIYLLGGRPAFPLIFARDFVDPSYLQSWLNQRDWRRAWFEGNLIFYVGQCLIYLRDFENLVDAQSALDIYFAWLDREIDPATGLWGTNGYCDVYEAVYGAYHQLLAYYYDKHPLPYASRTVDVVLGLQHHDGGFAQHGGGGACEDVDAVDVLVNMYKLSGHRRSDVLSSLRRALQSIEDKQTVEGGFVYRWGEPYLHNGLAQTWVPANEANVFSTWFRTHTIALICQILHDTTLAEIDWQFNTICSMGWHDKEKSFPAVPASGNQLEPTVDKPRETTSRAQGTTMRGQMLRRLLEILPAKPMERFVRGLARRYVWSQSAQQSLAFLSPLQDEVDQLVEMRAREFGKGLHPAYWSSRYYEFFLDRLRPGEQVLYLGSGNGDLAFTIASLSRAKVVAFDFDENKVAHARRLFSHPRLCFTTGDLPQKPIDVIMIVYWPRFPKGYAALVNYVIERTQASRWLVRLSTRPQDWRQALACELNRSTNTLEKEFQLLETLQQARLTLVHSEKRWGEIWAEFSLKNNDKDVKINGEQ